MKRRVLNPNTKIEKCSYCNKLIKYEHSKYCTNCGRKIRVSNQD